MVGGGPLFQIAVFEQNRAKPPPRPPPPPPAPTGRGGGVGFAKLPCLQSFAQNDSEFSLFFEHRRRGAETRRLR